MRTVYLGHNRGHMLAALVAAALMMGCVKNPEVDALRADMDAQKVQLAALRADADEHIQQRAALRVEVVQQSQQLAELRAKLANLETLMADLKPRAQKQPASSGSEQLTTQQTEALRQVISQCVQIVRALAPPGATRSSDVHISFDAYFNPALGRVVNNNQYVSQDAVYAFNRCMTEKGWPLR
jgi:septal ring factor EnvC (AmiA/AmiB activator)